MSEIVKTITTNEFTMDYVSFGKGERALIIIPGLSVQSVMGSADAIAQAYDLLTEDFTLYVFDRRKDLPSSYSVQDMARDTAAAIKELGLNEVSIFGASQGGMIAMLIAIDNPGLVSKLILGSTSSCISKGIYTTIENWIGLARNKDAKGLYFAFGEALYPKEIFDQSGELLTQMASTVTPEELERFIILAKSMDGFDITSGLSGITCPALILGDNDDRVLGPEASDVIAKNLGGDTDIYMYDGFGHAVYDLAPDYRERMLNFLR